MELRYGLKHVYRRHALEEISAEMGLSRRKVTQLLERALEKLRVYYGVIQPEEDEESA